MSTRLIVRGMKNAFRNSVRLVGIAVILALSISLVVVMLVSRKAVQARIDGVQGSIGNTITVSPAGARGFEGGGNPLVTADLAKIRSTPHVHSVVASINDRWTTVGTSAPAGRTSFGGGTTSLVTPTAAGSLGDRFGGDRIRVTGTTDPTNTQVSGVNQVKIVAGTKIDGNGTALVALVGKDLAAKNSLAAGSTFSAYGQNITVAGLYDAGNAFANAGVVMPLAALQNLSGQPGDVTNVLVGVDSLANAPATVTTLQHRLGTKADVVLGTPASVDTITSLDNIKTIASYSVFGALGAGAVIIFLSMLMIVRERRREIGILKAIGSSNWNVSAQFVVEALTFTGIAAVLGAALGVVLSQPVLDQLVSATATGGAGRFGRDLGRGITQFGTAVSNVHTTIGFGILLYGLAAATVIAIVGTAVPAWFIARIRPAEVMRNE